MALYEPEAKRQQVQREGQKMTKSIIAIVILLAILCVTVFCTSPIFDEKDLTENLYSGEFSIACGC